MSPRIGPHSPTTYTAPLEDVAAPTLSRTAVQAPPPPPVDSFDPAPVTVPRSATPSDWTAYGENLRGRLDQAGSPAARALLIQAEDANLRRLGASLVDPNLSSQDLGQRLAQLADTYQSLPAGERGQYARALGRDIPPISSPGRLGHRELGEALTMVPQAAPLVSALGSRATTLQNGMIPAVQAQVAHVREARTEFERVDGQVRALDAQAGRLAAELGPMLTPQQLEAAAANFRRENNYDALLAQRERAAASLTGAVSGAAQVLGTEPFILSPLGYARRELQQEIDASLMQADRLSSTPAGRQMVSGLLGDNPDPAVLARATALSTGAATQNDFRTRFAAGVANTLGAQATELAAAGRTAEVPGVLAGLQRGAGLLGIDPSTVQTFRTEVERAAASGGTLTTEDTDRMQRAMGGVMGLSGTQLAPIRGLNALVAGLASGVGAVQGPNNAGDWLNMVGAGTQGASEATALALSLSRFGTPGAQRALQFAGAAGAVIGSAGNALQAYSAFARGDNVEGGIRTAEALGGVLLAIPSGWTQVAGGALMAGALAVDSWRWYDSHSTQEAQVQSFLRGAGLSPSEAEQLGDLSTSRDSSARRTIGPLIAEAAPLLGTDPQRLLATIRGLPESQRAALMRFIDNTDLQNGVGGQSVSVRNQSIDHNPRGWTEGSGAEILVRWLRANNIPING